MKAVKISEIFPKQSCFLLELCDVILTLVVMPMGFNVKSIYFLLLFFITAPLNLKFGSDSIPTKR